MQSFDRRAKLGRRANLPPTSSRNLLRNGGFSCGCCFVHQLQSFCLQFMEYASCNVLCCPISSSSCNCVRQGIVMDHNLTIGSMGDSTTRSDLRAWEEEFNCPRTDLGERNVFQKLKEDGLSYVCSAREQSMHLTKCLIPPIVNLTNCPRDSAIAFRYFYKIYPWTPLDQWYLKQPGLFQDIDVLVISMGRWFGYYNWNGLPLNVTNDTETFLTQLRKVSVVGKDSLPE